MRELSILDRQDGVEEISVDGMGDDAIVVRAVPVIETVIRRRCRYWKIADDVRDDLRSETVMRLLKRLRDPQRSPIGTFEDYVAAVTSRVIDDLVRAISPEWARLKHRIRYVLNHDDRFCVSILADGRIRCSLQAAPAIGARRVRTRAADVLTKMVLDVLAHPEEGRTIDDLVNAVAARMGIADPIRTSGDHIAAAHTSSPLSIVESTESLHRLWSEIVALPRRQRLALLLNARDPAGESVLRLLIAERIVTMQELAATLEISAAELDALWNGVPLIDAAIAERLQVTRQQVINLRKAARDRLARRMERPR
ncbi:MAG TPA: hypothetical protein VGQ36_24390 [Thermoanaerobaculia bacterium]|jgi:hypothetical protein|nr:hypothetical protein [Thermoanaerobaculia bacterium]